MTEFSRKRRFVDFMAALDEAHQTVRLQRREMDAFGPLLVVALVAELVER